MTVMDFETAGSVERVKVVEGERYPFYSTLHGTDGHGVLCRLFTGQTVTVVADHGSTETSSERIFTVRADSGCIFSAWEGELNGWYRDTGQFYNEDGTWGPNREPY